MNFAADIPLSLAVAAHSGTSFVPDKRGASEVAGYGAELQGIYEVLQAAAVKGGTTDLLEAEFSRLRAGFRARYTKWLGSRSRIVSWMIAGPSNFPVRRNEKRNSCADRRLTDLIEFKARAIQAAIRTLRPDLRPIMSGDADAVERLQAQIVKAELVVARMKAANAALRKYRKQGPEAQARALVEAGFSDSQAKRLLQPDCMGCVGFPSCALSNDGANIRRMKARLAQIERAQATPEREAIGSNGIVLTDCPPENRVRLAFPGKPSEEVRTKLKKNGFRWTPSMGVWQAYRNSNSLAIAQQMVTG